MGRAGRPGPAGEGLARDETGIRARAAGSIALTSSGGGRLAGRNRGRDPKGDARWYIQSEVAFISPKEIPYSKRGYTMPLYIKDPAVDTLVDQYLAATGMTNKTEAVRRAL